MPDLKSLLGEKAYSDVIHNVYREVSLAVIAQVQMVKERNKRIMGSRFDMQGRALHRYLDRADAVRRKCATIRQIYYRPIFISALRLIDKYQKEGNDAKVEKIRRGLVYIGIVYNTYYIIEEAANECFDEVYNQTEVMAVQGFNPPDDDEGGPTRMVVEESRVRRDSRRRHAHADEARDMGLPVDDLPGIGEGQDDPFTDALKKAAEDAFGEDYEDVEVEEDDMS